MTLLRWIGASFWIRPPCGLRWFGRTCFHTRLIPSTTTRSLSDRIRRTRPVLPLSAPEITTTVSPDLMCRAMSISLNHFTRERDDLHEVLVSQLPRDGAKDAGAARVVFLVDHDGGVLVEADVAAVGADGRLLRADDDAADDLAVLHVPAGQRFLHRADDHVADRRDLALELALAAAAAKDLDAHRLLRAGVVGDVEHRLLLNHCRCAPFWILNCGFWISARSKITNPKSKIPIAPQEPCPSSLPRPRSGRPSPAPSSRCGAAGGASSCSGGGTRRSRPCRPPGPRSSRRGRAARCGA